MAGAPTPDDEPHPVLSNRPTNRTEPNLPTPLSDSTLISPTIRLCPPSTPTTNLTLSSLISTDDLILAEPFDKPTPVLSFLRRHAKFRPRSCHPFLSTTRSLPGCLHPSPPRPMPTGSTVPNRLSRRSVSHQLNSTDNPSRLTFQLSNSRRPTNQLTIYPGLSTIQSSTGPTRALRRPSPYRADSGRLLPFRQPGPDQTTSPPTARSGLTVPDSTHTTGRAANQAITFRRSAGSYLVDCPYQIEYLPSRRPFLNQCHPYRQAESLLIPSYRRPLPLLTKPIDAPRRPNSGFPTTKPKPVQPGSLDGPHHFGPLRLDRDLSKEHL